MVYIFVGDETRKKKSLNQLALNLLVIFKSNGTNIKITHYLVGNSIDKH